MIQFLDNILFKLYRNKQTNKQQLNLYYKLNNLSLLMVHQYESDDKRTGLEIKYTDFSSKYADPKEALRVAHDVIDPPHLDDKNKKSLPEKINPNPRFVESYNQRVAKEEEEARKVAERKKYNQKGELKAEIYLKEDFQSLHDPLGNF